VALGVCVFQAEEKGLKSIVTRETGSVKPIVLFERTTTTHLPTGPPASQPIDQRLHGPMVRPLTGSFAFAQRSLTLRAWPPVDSLLAGKGTHVFDFEVREGINDLNFEVGE